MRRLRDKIDACMERRLTLKQIAFWQVIIGTTFYVLMVVVFFGAFAWWLS